MISISNEFQPLPDEMKLFSLYVNRYLPKQEKEFKNCEEPQIINEKEKKEKEIDISILMNPLFIGVGVTGIAYYTIGTSLQFALGSIFYAPTIGVHAIGNLGGLTNLYRHSKYIYSYIHMMAVVERWWCWTCRSIA